MLNEAAREEYSFAITCERPMPKLPAELRAPVFSAAAKRLESGVALFAGKGVEVTAQPAATLRQTPITPPSDAWGRLIAAYDGTGALAYRAALAEARREARVDYAYQVNRRKIELIASLQLFAKGDDLRAMTVALPAQFDVQAVQSERLQDWWREGDTLHLRFAGATPEMTPLVVYLVRQYAAAPTELEVQPLVLDGFKKVSGEAVIAAHKGVEVTMKLSAEGTEIAPEKAATDFQILPPLERKRGFTFKDQKFAAQVALAALPAKTNALWVMHAQAHEGWVGVSTHAQLTMRQGSIDRAAFSLPAAVPEARVTGDEVRETRVAGRGRPADLRGAVSKRRVRRSRVHGRSRAAESGRGGAAVDRLSRGADDERFCAHGQCVGIRNEAEDERRRSGAGERDSVSAGAVEKRGRSSACSRAGA